MRIGVRVDASPAIGTGHLMRCMTLANALKRRGAKVRFVSREMPDHLRAMIAANDHEFRALPARAKTPEQKDDASDSIEALGARDLDWLIVDHYQLGARWESALRGSTRRIMAIDDLADREHDCDVLLDQNLYADARARYSGKVPAHCRTLLGPRYALLADEYVRLRAEAVPRGGPVNRVLVFFGGMDAENHTSRAIAALQEAGLHKKRVDVVVGALHPQLNRVVSECEALGFECHVQTARMAELALEADMAVAAGGSAVWERCCLGLPSLVFATAGNQARQVEDAAAEGLVCAPRQGADLGLHVRAFAENPALRVSISRNAMRSVDGRGVLRVLAALSCGRVAVRNAVAEDSGFIHAWRNHPSIRAVSATQAVIPLADHERWLANTLRNPQRALLIGMAGTLPVGVARFDIEGGTAEVSIYLDPGADEPGLGHELLAAAEDWLGAHRPEAREVRARVLGNNGRSRRLFLGAGYSLDSSSYSKRLHENA